MAVIKIDLKRFNYHGIKSPLASWTRVSPKSGSSGQHLLVCPWLLVLMFFVCHFTVPLQSAVHLEPNCAFTCFSIFQGLLTTNPHLLIITKDIAFADIAQTLKCQHLLVTFPPFSLKYGFILYFFKKNFFKQNRKVDTSYIGPLWLVPS